MLFKCLDASFSDMVGIHLAGTLVRASHVEGLEGAELVEADDVGILGLVLKQQ